MKAIPVTALFALFALVSCAGEPAPITLSQLEDQLTSELGALPMYVARIDSGGHLEDRFEKYNLGRDEDVRLLTRRLELRFRPTGGRVVRGETVVVLADPAGTCGPVLTLLGILTAPTIDDLHMRLGDPTAADPPAGLVDMTYRWQKPVLFAGVEEVLELRLEAGEGGSVRYSFDGAGTLVEAPTPEGLRNELVLFAAGLETPLDVVAVRPDKAVPVEALHKVLGALSEAGFESLVVRS